MSLCYQRPQIALFQRAEIPSPIRERARVRGIKDRFLALNFDQRPRVILHSSFSRQKYED